MFEVWLAVIEAKLFNILPNRTSTLIRNRAEKPSEKGPYIGNLSSNKIAVLWSRAGILLIVQLDRFSVSELLF